MGRGRGKGGDRGVNGDMKLTTASLPAMSDLLVGQSPRLPSESNAGFDLKMKPKIL